MWFIAYNRSPGNVNELNCIVYIIGLVLGFLTWVPWSLRIVWKSICVYTFFTLGKRSCSDLGILVTAVNLPSYSDPGEGGSSGGENGRRTWDRWLDRGFWGVQAERCWEKIGIGEKQEKKRLGKFLPNMSKCYPTISPMDRFKFQGHWEVGLTSYKKCGFGVCTALLCSSLPI